MCFWNDNRHTDGRNRRGLAFTYVCTVADALTLKGKEAILNCENLEQRDGKSIREFCFKKTKRKNKASDKKIVS